jgi:hypothetical protein
MWLIAFSSWRLRNWRVALVLVLGSASILAAGLLPAPLGALLQGALWIGFTAFILMRGERLSGIRGAEYAFIEHYNGILQQIAALKRDALSHEPSAYVAEFERAIEGLEALEPPSADWDDLKTDTARELRRRLVMMRLGARPSPETMDAANASWDDVEGRYRRMLKEKARFWAGLSN